MGNAVNRLANTLIRPIREYNLYDRAHKSVIKNKYEPSPKHPSTQEMIEKSIDELPSEVKENLSRNDPSLEERLRQVYVTSQDVTPLQPPPKQNPNRPLPSDRGQHEAAEYGFVEPKVVPYGKVTLKGALQFITAHQSDPNTNTADSIACMHKLDQRLTEQVLHHFGTFRLYVPTQQTAGQQELLKLLEATPTALPVSVDLKRRLQGVAMGSTDPHSLPLHKFPEPVPGLQPFSVTLSTPLPTDGSFPITDDKLSVKDEGMVQYVVQEQDVPMGHGGKESVERSNLDAVKPNKGGVSKRSAKDGTQSKGYITVGKD